MAEAEPDDDNGGEAAGTQDSAVTAANKAEQAEDLFEMVQRYEKNPYRRSWKLPVAFVCLLVSALVALLMARGIVSFGLINYREFGFYSLTVGAIYLFYGVTAVICCILVTARKWHKFALAMAFPSIFILVFPGIVAIALILLAEDEFRD